MIKKRRDLPSRSVAGLPPGAVRGLVRASSALVRGSAVAVPIGLNHACPPFPRSAAGRPFGLQTDWTRHEARDAVLVADMSDSQSVKQAVTVLQDRRAKQAVQFPKDHRPWGWYETLVLADRFQVKRIHVHPGAALSLQSHVHRSEHWIVVAGTARVTVDDRVQLLSENQSIYIPLGAVHRMENPGRVPMVLIEVQTGPYLGEDDIIRYEDIYARK